MKSILIAALLAISAPVSAQEQHIWFTEAFQSGTSMWHALSGEWKFTPGVASITSEHYERILASTFATHGEGPWTIEVSLRGAHAGIVFGLEDTSAKAFCHVVRLDENSVLSGYLDAAGGFTARDVFFVSRSASDWTTLRVDVDPPGGTYDVLVNGVKVGTDTSLLFPSGHIGLEGSDGSCEFRSVTVRGLTRHPAAREFKRGAHVHFTHVSFIRGGRNNVVIYNVETQSYQAFDMQGKLLRQQKAPRPRDPGPSARANGLQYTADREGITVSDGARGVIRKIPLPFGLPSSMLVDRTGAMYVADGARHALVRVSADGELAGTFTARCVGGLLGPRGMDFYGSDEIVIADDNRIIFIGRDLRDSVEIRAQGARTLSVSWNAVGTRRPLVRYAPDFERGLEAEAQYDRHTGVASAELHGIREATRYSVVVSNALRVIGSDEVFSAPYRWVSAPGDSSMMMVARLPLLYMVYRNISSREKYPAAIFRGVPTGRSLTSDDIAYLKEACRFNREFFFQNSFYRLVIDFSFAVIDDTLHLGEVGSSDPYGLAPSERTTRDIERASRSFGRHPSDYAGVIVTYPWANSPSPSGGQLDDNPMIRQAYGGLTLGVPASWKYGASTGYSALPFPEGARCQDWLITHEFQHQLQALMHRSGYTDTYNPDEPWKLAGRFGEDFDFSAHLLRSVPPVAWLGLKTGRIALARDANHDGIPDDDASLPLDRKRLSPKIKPGEGLARNIDPDSVHRFEPVIHRAGVAGPPFRPFAALKAEDLSAMISAGWTDSALYVSVEADKPSTFLLQIDGNADGWFHGFDNLQVRVSFTGAKPEVIDDYLRDCSSWREPPHDRKDVLKSSDLTVWGSLRSDTTHTSALERAAGDSSESIFRVEEHRILTLRIARQDVYGLSFTSGKHLAVRFGLQSVPDRWVWDELFERNSMMMLELR